VGIARRKSSDACLFLPDTRSLTLLAYWHGTDKRLIIIKWEISEKTENPITYLKIQKIDI